MRITETITTFAVNRALEYVKGDPKQTLPKLMNWVDRFDIKNTVPEQRRVIREAIENPDSNWNQLLMSLWSDIDDDVRTVIFRNFILNASLKGIGRQNEAKAKYDCNIPWAILMDPTSACNLHCTGCWAAEYGDKLNMSYETLDSIIRQGKETGTFMYIYSGGEPLVRKKDILRLCEAHPDAVFLAFTNGTLIDEDFADEMLRVKNFIPAISVEGSEAETDSRRGTGTYAQVDRAMEILKSKRLPFGASCCYTSANTETIGSEAYFDELIEKGNKFAWFFTYMPVGTEAVPELLASDEQRAYMYRQVRKFRDTKPLFTMDFWNDGEFVNGCVAGGRFYLHINAGGDIEPCAFIHYSDSNIHEKTLLEAYQSPLFQEYRKGQPFNDNLLRPCPLLDNPDALVGMVQRSGAKSTDMQSPEDVENLADKCRPVADKWAETSQEIWIHSEGCRRCAEKKAKEAARQEKVAVGK